MRRWWLHPGLQPGLRQIQHDYCHLITHTYSRARCLHLACGCAPPSQAQVFWARIKQMQEEDVPVYVTVTGATRGGLLVQYEHLEGFIPISHLGQVSHHSAPVPARAHVHHKTDHALQCRPRRHLLALLQKGIEGWKACSLLLPTRRCTHGAVLRYPDLARPSCLACTHPALLLTPPPTTTLALSFLFSLCR